MIEKIRRALVVRNMFIVAGILLLGGAVSYTVYRYSAFWQQQENLRDYLAEELREAEDFVKRSGGKPETKRVEANIHTLHDFSYWVVDGRIVWAEHPYDNVVAEKLEQRILTKVYEAGKVYYENVKYNRQKWYFVVLKGDLKLAPPHKGEVFVVSNYTQIKRNSKTYIKVAVSMALIMIFIAYLISSFFTGRLMKYIEQSYLRQKQFVSNAAHEFRTPLAVLHSYAELLEYNPQKKEIVADIKAEIQQMNDMLDKLLSIARYDDLNMVIRRDDVLLNRLISSVVRAMSVACPEGKFELVGTDKEVRIVADEVMIRQLLYILLDNAVKYTGKDKRIVVGLIKQHFSVKISVADNGIGIKKEDLQHIYERFWQAETSHHQQGMGLGLSLAESIVRWHDGTINVRSKFGRGSVFEVVLPLVSKLKKTEDDQKNSGFSPRRL